MLTVKFRKVPELFRNRKVRTLRTEQLWFQVFYGSADIISLGVENKGLGGSDLYVNIFTIIQWTAAFLNTFTHT